MLGHKRDVSARLESAFVSMCSEIRRLVGITFPALVSCGTSGTMRAAVALKAVTLEEASSDSDEA